MKIFKYLQRHLAVLKYNIYITYIGHYRYLINFPVKFYFNSKNIYAIKIFSEKTEPVIHLSGKSFEVGIQTKFLT